MRAIQPVIRYALLIAVCFAGDVAGQSSDMSTLARLRTDKGPLHHGYTEIYEYLFSPLRGDSIRILEIGVAEGGSLELWEDYFRKASIFGLDIEDKSDLERPRVVTYVADQADRSALAGFVARHGGEFDVIIDDGGHSMEQQQVSLGFLFQFVKPGGYYVIEDVHSSFFEQYGVDEEGRNTTFRMLINYFGNAEVTSDYMFETEEGFLEANVEYANLFFRNNEHHSMMCVLKRKAAE